MAVTQLENCAARRPGRVVGQQDPESPAGSVFKKDTIKQVFKIAKELGYDFSRLKYHHKRVQRAVPSPSLGAVDLQRRRHPVRQGRGGDQGRLAVGRAPDGGGAAAAVIPLRPHTIGIRMLDGALKGVEIMARPIRLAHAGQNMGMNLAVEFLRTEEAKLKKLRKVL
jgi:hypothetical protein